MAKGFASQDDADRAAAEAQREVEAAQAAREERQAQERRAEEEKAAREEALKAAAHRQMGIDYPH